jgi:hypothetical protein
MGHLQKMLPDDGIKTEIHVNTAKEKPMNKKISIAVF